MVGVALPLRYIRLAMQSDARQAAQNLTRAYLTLAMFLFALIVFQLFMGESLGVARTREDQPRAYWTVLGVQIAAFAFLIALLYLHNR